MSDYQRLAGGCWYHISDINMTCDHLPLWDININTNKETHLNNTRYC